MSVMLAGSRLVFVQNAQRTATQTNVISTDSNRKLPVNLLNTKNKVHTKSVRHTNSLFRVATAARV